MGLLDALQSPEAQLGLGLLSAAGPSAVPMSFGQRLGGAMQQFQAAKIAEEERRQKAAMQALQARLIESQIGETQAQALQRQAAAQEAQRKAAEAARIQGVVKNAFMPVTGSDANAVSGVTGPRPEALSVVGSVPPVNYQALIAQGVPPELAKSLAEARNYGRDKVARTVDGTDENGAPVTYQLDEYGNRTGAPIKQWKAPEKVDVGGQIQFRDPVSLRLLTELNKSNTPDALLGAQTTMRGQNMTDARAREKNQIDKEAVGKVEWKQDVNGKWIALPKEISGNGPVVPIEAQAPGKREQQARNAIDVINSAEQLIGKATSSYAGAGVDAASRLFGVSNKGADAAAQLKALEGALMMSQPRMEGPQSDKDVQLYRQMAGQIGDSTIPVSQKQAALQTIKQLHQKYTGVTAAPPMNVEDLVNKYRSR